jgi:DNA-binding MurR/RpiR family transcriptional regulator
VPRGAGDRVPTLAESITAAMPSLTNAERKAARTLLAHYPGAGIETATLFAERAGVSAPTVLRFIAKLGFDGYAEFRSRLREELEAREQFPLTRLHGLGSRSAGLAALGERLSDTVTDTLAMCERSEFDRLVAALCDERRHIYLLGGDFTDVAARHLEFHLRKMRPRVRLLDHDLIRRADIVADLRRRDVLIVFDIRRYQPDTVATARLAAQRGAMVVLITDQWMSDAAEVADLVFRARVDGPSRWDSLVGMIALVEVLVQAYDEEAWSRSEQRVKAIEDYRAQLDSALAHGADRAGRRRGGGRPAD